MITAFAILAWIVGMTATLAYIEVVGERKFAAGLMRQPSFTGDDTLDLCCLVFWPVFWPLYLIRKAVCASLGSGRSDCGGL